MLKMVKIKLAFIDDVALGCLEVDKLDWDAKKCRGFVYY